MNYSPEYPQAPGYPPPRPASPATAVCGAVSALVSGGALLYMCVDAVSVLSDIGFVNLPSELYVILGWQALAGLFLVLGAVLTFARKSGGPWLTIIGALGALSAVVVEPVILKIEWGHYFSALFDFGTLRSILVAVALVEAVFALLFSIMPSTVQWARGAPPAPAGYLPGGHHPGW